ncbi:lipopolysaccharide biosynthesis protein [Pseudoalteromonas sp. SWXJZ10B]|uniref:lipopolysaccharide biosynthesis protein n=1 Tax=Pseudoalteromonas sp. SWXJZ10B TaxID=2792063 RepID=UPI0018CE708E|nr:oligosaccharide flippase family protein [Pseudoalteromonas sp. SWXJZ10B]MBH0042058.1 oligosaccharide flippase family protein [Pseudoalteromonas sp. SWXJZ10B]
MLTIKNAYYRKIAVLFSGTGLAQLINLVGLPFLTRLYSPEHFAWFSFYSACVAILTLVATLKFENHILLSKSQSGVTHSVSLVKIISLFVSSFVALSALVLSFFIKLNLELVLFISLGSGFAAWNLANYYLLNRLGEYSAMARSRVLGAVVFLISAISLTNFIYGLLWASLAGVLSSVVFTSINGGARRVNINKSLRLLKSETSYYRIVLPSSFLDVLSSQIPLIFSKGNFSLDKVGNYGLYNKCVSLPSAILGKAVADVFKKEAFKLLNENQSAKAIYLDTAKKMLYIGLLPYILLQFYGGYLFMFAFGAEWYFAGEIAQIMAIRFYMGFVISPLSTIIYFGNYKKLDFIIQFLMALSIGACLIVSYLFNDFLLMIKGLTIIYVVKYILQFWVGYRIACSKVVY